MSCFDVFPTGHQQRHTTASIDGSMNTRSWWGWCLSSHDEDTGSLWAAIMNCPYHSGPYPGGGGSRGSDEPPDPPTCNYRVPPAHRFRKYKLRLLYFRMQKLTPYSIKFIQKHSGGACPQTLLGRHCADDARPPPPAN